MNTNNKNTKKTPERKEKPNELTISNGPKIKAVRQPLTKATNGPIEQNLLNAMHLIAPKQSNAKSKLISSADTSIATTSTVSLKKPQDTAISILTVCPYSFTPFKFKIEKLFFHFFTKVSECSNARESS
jgi:hypothetical protein